MIQISQFGPVTRFDLARALPAWRYWTTAYLVDGLLVDSGCAHCVGETLAALAGTPLAWIANTHTHEDHIGANGTLQSQKPGLEIYAHPQALPILADPHGKQPLQPYRRLFWGWPTPSIGKPVENGDVISTNQYQFQVIYTPGHSSDHICLYESNQGWLFSGDLFVGGQERALRAGTDIWQLIASLKRIAELPMSWLFPGSARVRQNPINEVNRKIAYLEKLGDEVVAHSDQGWNVERIARKLLGPPKQVELITMGHFSRRCLVLSYLGLNQE